MGATPWKFESSRPHQRYIEHITEGTCAGAHPEGEPWLFSSLLRSMRRPRHLVGRWMKLHVSSPGLPTEPSLEFIEMKSHVLPVTVGSGRATMSTFRRSGWLLVFALVAGLARQATAEPVTAIILTAKGLAWLGAALGLGSKAIILTAATFKAAAIGTAFLVKGIAFTKIGATAMMVAVGTATYSQVTDATVETMRGMGYKADGQASLDMVRTEIGAAVRSRGDFTIRYCLYPNGDRVVADSSWRVCPHDGSEPRNGEQFMFRNEAPAR